MILIIQISIGIILAITVVASVETLRDEYRKNRTKKK